jgi:branched-chain amino acid transport system ATP-binding protein
MTALLTLDGLHKRFGGVTVIDGLSTRLGEGEALGIVGPNGAGKTTLFNLVSGELSPDAGTVTFAGRDITSARASSRCRAGIGRTHQMPLPFGGMTVFENVLVGTAHGAGRRGQAGYAAGERVLALTGLADRANTAAADLGLLDRKRLEMARALATAPRLLLLDEVAGGLTDPEVAELVATVRAVHDEGVAIIWIEHIVHALTSFVSRLLCLAAGRVIADGDPVAVMASPEVRQVYLGNIDLPPDGASSGQQSAGQHSAGQDAP